MGSPLTMVRERERRVRGGYDNEGTETGEGGEAGDIYREIKKSREKLSVTGARPCLLDLILRNPLLRSLNLLPPFRSSVTLPYYSASKKVDRDFRIFLYVRIRFESLANRPGLHWLEKTKGFRRDIVRIVSETDGYREESRRVVSLCVLSCSIGR